MQRGYPACIDGMFDEDTHRFSCMTLFVLCWIIFVTILCQFSDFYDRDVMYRMNRNCSSQTWIGPMHMYLGRPAAYKAYQSIDRSIIVLISLFWRETRNRVCSSYVCLCSCTMQITFISDNCSEWYLYYNVCMMYQNIIDQWFQTIWN